MNDIEDPAAFCSGVFIWFGKKRDRKEEKVQRFSDYQFWYLLGKLYSLVIA